MITGVNHIAIATDSLDKVIPFYRDQLGLEFLGIEEVAEQKVRVAFFQAGTVRIELLEPTADDSPVARFVERTGGGLHHIALETEDINQQIAQLQQKQVRMIDQQPRRGAHNTRIAFIHPKAAHGVLVEVTQPLQES